MSDRTPFTALIQHVAVTYALPFPLLEAQVIVESAGDSFAFRYEHDYFLTYIKDRPTAKAYAYGPFAACSIGLMQVLVETACENGFTDRPERLFDPKIGLAFGAKVMSDLWDAVGRRDETYRRALGAYNGGRRLLTAPEAIWPPAVQHYVAKVYGTVAQGEP